MSTNSYTEPPRNNPFGGRTDLRGGWICMRDRYDDDDGAAASDDDVEEDDDDDEEEDDDEDEEEEDE